VHPIGALARRDRAALVRQALEAGARGFLTKSSAPESLVDAVRALHLKHGRVKFLGSYPIAGEALGEPEPHVDARWQAARDWVAGLQAMVDG
jgi:DNA-binding response OmpR family regulator